MDLEHPFGVVTPTVDGDVLGVLSGADAEFTSGDIHRIAGRPSPAGIRRTLDRLTDQGIVLRRPAGRAYLCRLNREHLAAPAILALAAQRSELLRRLGADVESWPQPPVFGAVFGSAARADHTTSSDLDLLLVAPADTDPARWEDACDRLAARATAWTGNDARILSLTEAQIRSGADADLLDSIGQDALGFIGDPGWLRRARAAGPHRDAQGLPR